MSDSELSTIKIDDIPMHPINMEETVNYIHDRVIKEVFTQHVVVNVAKIISMQKDSGLKEAVINCDLINIDGMGVVWGARWLGYDIPERVAGCDLFEHLLRMAETSNLPVFLLGAKQDVLDATEIKVKERFPNLTIAGTNHGYFWNNEKEVVDKIKNSGAKLLFVAISSPMKEQFINRWKDELKVDFAMGVGGTFDIWAGKTTRAPVWMQKHGLEWFYRVMQEPKRMWKRYLVTNAQFMILLLKLKLTHKK